MRLDNSPNMPSIQNSSFSILYSRLPLYIGAHTLVSLDDGPSLLLAKATIVDCRYPLQRISRLVLNRSVCMQADVIPACLEEGIPLIWRYRNGSAMAVALPLQAQNQGLSERVAIMMARKDWRLCYQAWVAAQQNMAMRALSRRFHIPVLHGNKHDVWLEDLWQRYGVRKSWAEKLLHTWQTMTVALIVEYWRKLDISTEMLSAATDGWNVLQDMAECLVLDMVVELIWRKKNWQKLMHARQADIDFALIKTFERRQPHLLKLLGAMHARFHRWLLDMEPWR